LESGGSRSTATGTNGRLPEECRSQEPLNPLHTEIEDFVHSQRPHGTLTADANEPAWNGYLLTVACSCGVVFERWITSLDAELDLLRTAGLN
jgi:hypothetical protein